MPGSPGSRLEGKPTSQLAGSHLALVPPIPQLAPDPSVLAPHLPVGSQVDLPLETALALRSAELEAAGRTLAYRREGERVGRRFCAFLEARGVAAPVPLSALTTEHARAFLGWLQREPGASPSPDSADAACDELECARPGLRGLAVGLLGPTGAAQHAGELKSLARFCVREELLPHDPLAKFRVPKVAVPIVETFTADQLRLLLRAAALGPDPLRDRAIIYFLLATGVRASELCALERAHLQVREQRARVFGKGHKWRQVAFDPTTAKHLTRYLIERDAKYGARHAGSGRYRPSGDGGDGPDSPPQVFLGRTGAPMQRNSLQRLIARLGEAAGIGSAVRCSPHTFRHTFATTFLRAHPGALFHLQHQLGHTDLTMVRRYARLAESDGPPPGPGVVEALGLHR